MNIGMDVVIIGYGDGNRVRRRGSVTPMIRDVGSDGSALSSTCNGLRESASLPVPFCLCCFLLLLSSLLIFVAKLQLQTKLFTL